MRNIILKIESYLSNNISGNSISGVKFCWTTLYMTSSHHIVSVEYVGGVDLALDGVVGGEGGLEAGQAAEPGLFGQVRGRKD